MYIEKSFFSVSLHLFQFFTEIIENMHEWKLFHIVPILNLLSFQNSNPSSIISYSYLSSNENDIFLYINFNTIKTNNFLRITLKKQKNHNFLFFQQNHNDLYELMIFCFVLLTHKSKIEGLYNSFFLIFLISPSPKKKKRKEKKNNNEKIKHN